METVIEPNEEVQLDFAGPLPDELNKDAYILVAIDKWSKFPTAKVVSNTTADIAFKFNIAEIIKRLRITPHGVTKVSTFEAHMGRKLNTHYRTSQQAVHQIT